MVTQKILITGSSGFVGKNLCNYLEKNEITTLNRLQLSNPEVELFQNVQAIVHLAGKAHDLKKTSHPEQYYEVNFELTKQLYDAFLVSDAKKFIFMSSVKAAADAIEEVLTEEYLPNPKTDYGKSKLMAEQYIQSQLLPDGKSYYILRPCMIHGPGNKGNLNMLYNVVVKGIPYPLAAFENKRSFLSIENLCFVIDKLLNNEVPAGIYNVADDEALSTNEVVSLLSDSVNKKPKLWYIPRKAIQLLAKIGDKFKLPLNTERLNKLTENYVVSNNKIKNVLLQGFPVQAREGLKITANSFKK